MQVRKYAPPRKNIAKFFVYIASALILADVTQASEYIVDGYTDSTKKQIYEVVTKYRFPSILSQFTQAEFNQRYPNLNLIKTFKTKETEYEFIKNEVNKIDANTSIYAIPKSLYQFVVYDCFANNIFSCSDSEDDLFEFFYAHHEKTDLRKYAREGDEWGITKACARFMEDKGIQNAFWKVNDYVTTIYKRHRGDIRAITNEVLDAYRKSNRLLDKSSVLDQEELSAQYGLGAPRTETLRGMELNGDRLRKWSEIKYHKLKTFTKNYIISESKNPNYVICRGGFCKPAPELAIRKAICFSDGLGSGYVFDAGASAYVLSNSPNKLWILELSRVKLLKGEYPIFIPPAFHLLSAAGNGELFHIRTKVVQGVFSYAFYNLGYKDATEVSEIELSIRYLIKPIVAGYRLNQTPEYFTTQAPRMFRMIFENNRNDEYRYEDTNQGEFDEMGAKKLASMIQSIEEVSENGIFLSLN